MLRFLDYSLDPANAQLQRGRQIVPLRPKTLAVLRHLAERPGRLVSKRELLDTVWADTSVGEWVLTGCVRELRRALDDDARRPRIIETAHRLGYRFVAPLDAAGAEQPPAPASAPPTPVGRAAEVAELGGWLARAMARERQVGFVSGEAGIGKTTLVDALRARAAVAGCLVAHGKCLEHHGAAEPYLPVLEAVGRLCATPDGAPITALLRRHAPSWFAQLSGLLEPGEAAAVERQLGGTTRVCMLREMAALVEASTRPLVLVIEDLQWSDPATVDLVVALAERQDPAALLVVGTYRPVDVIVRNHPLKDVRHELALHGRCRQLWLGPLGVDAVAAYLRARLPGLASAEALARVVWERTDGNPLFVVNLVDHLLAEGAIVAADGGFVERLDAARIGVPKGLRQMIAMQADRLGDDEREVLETASLVGRAFSAAVVAAAAGRDVVAVEATLDRLARREQLVRATDEGAPAGPVAAGSYEFIHALYRDVLGDRVPPARRRLLHGRIAACLERDAGGRAAEIATDLAFHFEAAGEPERAAPHLETAAATAVHRGAHREAAAVLEHAIALLEPLDQAPDRAMLAIRLSIALGRALAGMHGWAHPAIERACERARRLGETTDDLPHLFQAVAALTAVYLAQGHLDRAGETTAQLCALMERAPMPLTAFAGNFFIGVVRFYGGALLAAHRHLDDALAASDGSLPELARGLQTQVLSYGALTRLHLGYPDQAREYGRRAAAAAASFGSPYFRSETVLVTCFLHLHLRDLDGLARASDEAIALGDKYGLRIPVAVGNVARGLVLVAHGDHEAGLATLRAGLEQRRATGQAIVQPTMLGLLADALTVSGRIDEGLATVRDAHVLAAQTGEAQFQAELHRIEAEAHRARSDDAAAERCFRQALAVAERQGARWWTLRAAAGLARLQSAHRKRAAARRLLEPVVASFTEGLDTPDVAGAAALLRALG